MDSGAVEKGKNICKEKKIEVNIGSYPLYLTLAGFFPCFQTLVTVSVWCLGRTCGQRREYEEPSWSTMLLFCFFWSLKLSLSQQIPVLSHVFAVDWKTPGQMQFTAIKSQEGSLRRLWRDHAHDSGRRRNLLWRWWSAYVCRSPPPKNHSKSVRPVS